ncbi:hypothetical protein HVA01_00970 [Halovibrio variabilis]|uniref:AsmA domain-containing protein n=1 Tax=Halovibrio variabilis TaxID=31910 RepID=A0A511UK16_9GAMM|nr:AsmA family protein [Halovibrio variabilis]GEN26451.1 hypothetical protein HVA01_00970 [Halovibrio variabilis]
MTNVASKRLAWGLVPLVAVALIILIIELIAWDFLKPVITERIEQSTGRSAAIHGDVEVSLFPRPQLALNKVALGNPEWAASNHLLEAEQATITPSLSDLLQGELKLKELTFSGLTLNLEQRTDGPPNWTFDDQQATPQAPTGQGADAPFDIPSISVSDSTVRYWGADSDTPLEASVSSLHMQTDDEELHTQATLTLQSPPFQQPSSKPSSQPPSQQPSQQPRRVELEAYTDPIAAFLNAEQTFGGDISLSAGESHLSGTFEIPQAPALRQLTADVELSLHNLGEWSQWLDLPQLTLASLEAAARLEREGSEWRIRHIDVEAAESHLSGELVMETTGEAPSLNGQLHASQLDVAALRAVLPENEQETGLSVPVLPALNGSIGLSIDRLLLEQALLQNVQTHVQLAGHTVALDALTFDAADGNIEASASLTSSPETVEADAQMTLKGLDITRLVGTLPHGDILDGELTLELEPIEQRSTFAPDTLLNHLRIANADIVYRNDEAGTELAVSLETTAEEQPPRLLLNAEGTFGDKPLVLQASGAPLASLVDLDNGALKPDYPFEAEATSNSLFVQADTTLASILAPQTLEADMVLAADSGQALENWIGPVLPPLPDFRLAGTLRRDHAQWNATEVDGEIGSTNVSGNLEVINSERTVVNLEIEAGRIDMTELISATSNESADDAQDDSLLAPLRSFDGQLALNATTLVLPNGLELGGLVLNAELEEGRLEAQPLQFRLGEGSLTASLALDAAQSPAAGRLDVELDDIALTSLGDTFTPLEDRLGRLSGELRMAMRETLPSDRRNDFLLPFIGQLMFEPSELRFSDPEDGTELTLNFETQGSAAGAQTFQMRGEGRYDGMPASLSLRGDPLLNARDPERPYAVDGEANVVETHLRLQGSLLRPLALEGLDLQLALEGPNPQRLSRLLGFALPELPPYSVSGDLNLQDQRWTLTDIAGVIGDSDLNGDLALDTNVNPPRLTGELSSAHLDIQDLGFLAGATPEEIEANDRFVLPDTAIITDAWQQVSAEVSYRGESVSAGLIPLTNVTIDFDLEEGRGRFEPVGFGVGEGNVDLTLDLDASTQPPNGTIQVEVQGVDLNDALRHWAIADESVGTFGGRGKLWIEGASVAELLASADGGVVMLMAGGQLDALLVEIAGLDAGQTFLSWLRDRDPIPIDCSYADLQVRDGVTQLDTAVMDTTDTTFTLGGQVDLNTERLDISIIAHPKDPSVFIGRSPLHLGGTFDNIETGVHREELIRRAGASAGLAALAGPLTALLPLIDVGIGADVDYCQGLISRSRDAIQEGGD